MAPRADSTDVTADSTTITADNETPIVFIGDPRFTVSALSFEGPYFPYMRFPQKDPLAVVPLTFDFTEDLEEGETLIGTPQVLIATEYGTDVTPGAVLVMPAGLDGTERKVIQPVGGGVHGAGYLIVMTCQTSNPFKTLTLSAVLGVWRMGLVA